MAKFYGKIGFAKTVETSPGIWSEGVVERNYSGDVLQDHRRWKNDGNLNDDLVLTVKISIVADDFVIQNLPEVRYVVWHGNAFSVNTIEADYPRYNLYLGGVYNGKQAESTE